MLLALTELHFAFDSSKLPDDACPSLQPVAEEAKANPEMRVVIEGHTDPIGTNVYNTGLSIRRAEAVHTQLLMMGVAPDQIVLTYYGEDGAPRASYQDDRRATVYLTRDSLAQVTDTTFDAHGIAIRWEQPKTVAEIESSNPVATR